MRTLYYLLIVITVVMASCRKDVQEFSPELESAKKQDTALNLTEVKSWLSNHEDTSISKLKPEWQTTQKITGKKALTVYLPGTPTFQNVKQGVRKLYIKADSSGTLSARILEIIPDAYTLQEFGKMPDGKFSGRILVYTPDHKLESGKLFSAGKPTGTIKTASKSMQRLAGIKGGYTNVQSAIRSDQLSYRIIQYCYWQDFAYVDGSGVFTIHSEQICEFQLVDDYNYYDGWDIDRGSDYPVYYGGGGYAVPVPPPPIPESSNLPDEDKPSVDPKKMMECFSAISNPNAAYQVKVHVQEPMAGTSFNMGPNSFGHVAIELTVNSGGQSITQVIGFYPSGSGTDKIVSDSRIVDNGDLEWDVSASFFVTQANFQRIVNFAANPPQGYHFVNYNCTSFVYTAATLGGINLPMGFATVGLAGPGGATTAQTPAGMGSELRAMKAANPTLNISVGGGRAQGSKGECN